MTTPGPTFLIELRPEPGVDDPIRALRWALKELLRQHRLRCISAVASHGTEVSS